MNGGSWHCTGDKDLDYSQEKEVQKIKWLSEEALKVAVKKQVNSKGEKERYKHLDVEFKTTVRRDKKDFLSDQCKEIEENKE